LILQVVAAFARSEPRALGSRHEVPPDEFEMIYSSPLVTHDRFALDF
jgi:hypothetical protein